MGVRGDLVLLERAIRHRWVTDDLKALTINSLRSALQSGDARTELRAANIVAILEAQNQKDEHKAVDVAVESDGNRFLEIAERLGIDIDAESVSEAGANPNIAAVGRGINANR
jgi:hypothetical protein